MTLDDREKKIQWIQGYNSFLRLFHSIHRFMGESFPWLTEASKQGLWADDDQPRRQKKTMEQMKQQWGFAYQNLQQ